MIATTTAMMPNNDDYNVNEMMERCRSLPTKDVCDILDNMEPEKLLPMLNAHLFGSAEHIRMSACIWWSLKRRGFNDFTMKAPRFFQQVAEGTLLSEAFMKLLGAEPTVQSNAVRLTPSEQQRYIIDGEDIDVPERQADGEITTRRTPLIRLSPQHVPLVFSKDGSIRSTGEMKALLAASSPPPVRESQPVDIKAKIEQVKTLTAIVAEEGKRAKGKKAALELERAVIELRQLLA